MWKWLLPALLLVASPSIAGDTLFPPTDIVYSGLASTCSVETMVNHSCGAARAIDNLVVMTNDSCPIDPCRVGDCAGGTALCKYSSSTSDWEIVSYTPFKANTGNLWCETFEWCGESGQGTDCSADLPPIWDQSDINTPTNAVESGATKPWKQPGSIQLDSGAADAGTNLNHDNGHTSNWGDFSNEEPLWLSVSIYPEAAATWDETFFIGFAAADVIAVGGTGLVFQATQEAVGIGREAADTADQLSVVVIDLVGGEDKGLVDPNNAPAFSSAANGIEMQFIFTWDDTNDEMDYIYWWREGVDPTAATWARNTGSVTAVDTATAVKMAPAISATGTNALGLVEVCWGRP